MAKFELSFLSNYRDKCKNLTKHSVEKQNLLLFCHVKKSYIILNCDTARFQAKPWKLQVLLFDQKFWSSRYIYCFSIDSFGQTCVTSYFTILSSFNAKNQLANKGFIIQFHVWRLWKTCLKIVYKWKLYHIHFFIKKTQIWCKKFLIPFLVANLLLCLKTCFNKKNLLAKLDFFLYNLVQDDFFNQKIQKSTKSFFL